MEPKKLLEKYYSRLAQESFLKSLLWGLVVGFSALLLSAIVCWYVGFKGIWVCIVLFVAATAISTPLFYFCRFRPTIKQTARRVDSLGLEERLLTMTELEGDNSYIAVKQREDAVQALKKVNARLIKFVFSVSLVVTLAIVGVFGTGMTTYAALSEVSGRDLIRQALEGPAAQYEVIYQVKGDGRIIGEERQVVTAGEKAQPVMAVADSDWVFVGWDDGNGNPLRLDTEINDDMVVYAVFEEMDGVDILILTTMRKSTARAIRAETTATIIRLPTCCLPRTKIATAPAATKTAPEEDMKATVRLSTAVSITATITRLLWKRLSRI